MIEAWPFLDILKTMLHGTADCAEVTWTLFGMSIPEWSLLAFAGCILFALYQLLRRA
ncbi:disulfide bond formation protein B [compost metagenome]